MSTVTFFQPHEIEDLEELLSKAACVAGIGITPGRWKTSADAKFLGLPSLISQAILNQYNQFCNIRAVIRAPIIIPHRAIKYVDNVFRIPSLDLVILNPSPYPFKDCYRICLDAEYAYVSLLIENPPWQEIDQQKDICGYESMFKIQDVILKMENESLYGPYVAPAALKVPAQAQEICRGRL